MPFRPVFALLPFCLGAPGHAQVCIWAEEFENSCAANCYANAYSGPNGAWTVANTGTNGSCANRFFVSCTENGNLVGACGSGCVAGANNETLHVGNELPGVCASPNACFFCPTGDCGAAYDAGCPAALCAFCCSCTDAETDKRATSPVINLTGYGPIIINLKFMENGQTTVDNATLWYFDGAVWSQLADLPKTAVCGSGQGTWTNFSTALPVSAWNNPNVRLGFRWVNNNDGVGADPSFAVDEVQLIIPYAPTGTGLIVNELSNGPSGAKEYIELLAVGPQCSTIDARLIKVDDNNGVMYNGFGSNLVGSGVAAGHIRFSNAAQWSNVPVGSLILLYNETDLNTLLPPDDPNDTAPNDSVYVLPSNHALMQGCSTRPNPTVTSGYYNATCVFGVGNWNYISLRNQGDAAQTRDPNGFYFHGISYGANTDNMNGGGLDNLRISPTDHTNKVIFFNDNNYRQAFNFTSAISTGLETPGAPNNALNAAYINQLVCLPLPIELTSFTAEAMYDRVRLEWVTATETNNAWFEVQRSSDGTTFTPIGIVMGAGDSQTEQRYVHDDGAPEQGMNYYRIRQVDLDGGSSTTAVEAVRWDPFGGAYAWIDGSGLMNINAGNGPGIWTLHDAIGRRVAQGRLDDGGQARSVLPPMASGIVSITLDAGGRASLLRLLIP